MGYLLFETCTSGLRITGFDNWEHESLRSTFAGERTQVTMYDIDLLPAYAGRTGTNPLPSTTREKHSPLEQLFRPFLKVLIANSTDLASNLHHTDTMTRVIHGEIQAAREQL